MAKNDIKNYLQARYRRILLEDSRGELKDAEGRKEELNNIAANFGIKLKE